MKKLFILLFLTGILKSVFAQAPQGFSYQAAVRNAAGQVKSNSNIKVCFSILDSVSNGAIVYKETHLTTTNTLGMMNLNVGMGTPIIGTLSGVNWGTNSKFLQIEIDTTTSGNNYMLIGVQQLMSVPYALYASNVINNMGVRIGYGQSGIWVCPNNIFQITVELWGGGGGGQQNCPTPGADGGKGGYLKQTYSVIPGKTYNIIVGSGGSISSFGRGYCGSGGPYDIVVSSGGNGGNSSFDGTLVAEGGRGGANGINGINGLITNWSYGQLGTPGLVSYIPNGWVQNPPNGVASGGIGSSNCGYSFIGCSATEGQNGYCIISY
jgi:hypothetical protein